MTHIITPKQQAAIDNYMKARAEASAAARRAHDAILPFVDAVRNAGPEDEALFRLVNARPTITGYLERVLDETLTNVVDDHIREIVRYERDRKVALTKTI
jgi:hypothetical protein